MPQNNLYPSDPNNTPENMPQGKGIDPVPSAQAEGENAPQKAPPSLFKEILSWVLTIAIAVIAALLIRTFIFEPVKVDGSSMADTLHHEEMVFVTKFDYLFNEPKRHDVVICHYPGRTTKFLNLITMPQNFVKRLIGLPGDTIEIRYDAQKGQKVFFINGEPLDEPYITPQRNSRLGLMEPITLGEDEYFVVGDNRDNSNDSRSIGPISRKAIIGHVRFVFFPFNQWRGIE